MPASTFSEKLEWRVDEYTARLRDWMARNGFLPGNREYNPFIVVCDSRTGSTMLISFLNSHSNVLSFWELFHTDRSQVAFNADGFRSKAREEAVVKLRNNNPKRFIEQEVFRVYPGYLRAVGFKLIYRQAGLESLVRGETGDQEVSSELWSYLRSRTDIKFIHLIRENLLRKKLSWKIAQATGNWGTGGAPGGTADSGGRPRVTLDPEECRDAFSTEKQLQRTVEQHLGDHDVLQTSYESILDSPTGELERIQRFLDLEVENLQTETEKQEKRALEDAIANYSELYAELKDTPWARFFDDTDPNSEVDEA
jgi:LPS sulfotransferase NodH